MEILTDEGLLTPISNASRCAFPRVRSYADVGHAAMGLRSYTGLNGTDLEHRLVTIGVPVPIGGRVFWPEHARTAWERLSVVESVERDGRRLLVARPNAPLRNGDPLAAAESANRRQPEHPRRLSAMESRVVRALADGHTNKLIAYELGLATSTVATLLARAARKLGCKSCIELTRAGRTLAPPSASQHGAREPA